MYDYVETCWVFDLSQCYNKYGMISGGVTNTAIIAYLFTRATSVGDVL